MTASFPLWLVGGLDPTAGAGVLRDVLTAVDVAPGLPLRTVVTTVTRQGHGRPAVAASPDVDVLRWQLAALPSPAAVKIGLVPADAVHPLFEAVRRLQGVPIVVDPVLRASDGGDLGSRPDALEPLLGLATLVTPNAAELRTLSGYDAGQEAAGWWTQRHPDVALLHKSALQTDDAVEDHLWIGQHREVIRHPRQPGKDPRGTGCALATAIACALTRGHALGPAVRGAIAWLDRARKASTVLPDTSVRLGSGRNADS